MLFKRVIKKGAKLTGIQKAVMDFYDESINPLHRAMTGKFCVITSGTDALWKHGDGNILKTLHDDGLALDIRIWYFNKNTRDIELFCRILRTLGKGDFDIILKPTHIHIEYDPKGEQI